MSSVRRAPLFILLFGLIALHGTLLAAPLRFLAWDADVAARKVGVKNGKDVVELKGLHPGQRTKAIQAAGTAEAPLQLLALDRLSADGKPTAADIKVPGDMKSPLVLIIPDPKHPSGLRTFVVEDNPGNFKWGTVRLLNATGKVLMMKHDKEVVTLPAAWTPVDLNPGGAERNVGVQLALKDNPKALIYSAVWEHDPAVRKLVFIVPGADVTTGVVDFKVVPEDRRVAEAEAAAANP